MNALGGRGMWLGSFCLRREEVFLRRGAAGAAEGDDGADHVESGDEQSPAEDEAAGDEAGEETPASESQAGAADSEDASETRAVWRGACKLPEEASARSGAGISGVKSGDEGQSRTGTDTSGAHGGHGENARGETRERGQKAALEMRRRAGGLGEKGCLWLPVFMPPQDGGGYVARPVSL